MTPPSAMHDPLHVPHSFAPLLDRAYERPDFLRGLKTLMAAAHERIRHEHDAGARGRNVVRHLTALVDDVVRTVFQYAQTQHPVDTEPCALVALGGYGRGELNPFSDIDLMFLCQKTPPDQLIRETLYLLWDVGYTIGHSTRTRRDVITMADTDLTAQTAMLEVRLLDGESSLFSWFREEVGRRRFTPRRRQAFIRNKIVEYRQRHAGFANTVNLMEPNVKESPGGLRDYHTALWLSTACYDASSVAALVDQALLTPSDQDAIETALDFLFRVRNALHYRRGRKNDLLSVEVQEPLAAALGFQPSEHKLAVEHFLKVYYMHANVLFNLCVTVIEAVTHPSRPKLWHFFRRPTQVGDGFVLVDGYVHHPAPLLDTYFGEHPIELMRAFAKAQAHQVPFTPSLSRAVRAQASGLANDVLRRSPETTALFWHILTQARTAATLREMHRHGVLEAYLPEFAPLTCLVQHDLYHRYTVDEHTFRSIEVLEGLAEPQDPALKPLAQLYQQTADQALLKFALLLHDLGKDVGPGQASHVYRSRDLAEVVCQRLALPLEHTHMVQLLALHHLVMNHIAQRRDITDEKVIAEFAGIIETLAGLTNLYLVTYADTSAVGPGVWNTWKGTLLADLHRRTRAYVLRQSPITPASTVELHQRLRPAIVAALDGRYGETAIDHFLEAMPSRYLLATPPAQMARHLMMTYPTLQAPVMLHPEHDVAGGFTAVTICVAERRGVFSMIAGALSRHKLNILGAQIYTSRHGVAVDTLQVETIEHTPATDARLWQQIEAALLAALQGEDTFALPTTARRLSPQERAQQAFAKAPQVLIDNSSSDSHTLIEIQAQDQLGLLYKLTRVLYEHGLDVALAKISTEANRAIDVFYVTDTAGGQITGERETEQIRQALCDALREA